LLAQTSNDIDFLTGLPDFEHVKTMLPDYLNRVALDFLDQRERTVARISTVAQVAERRSSCPSGCLPLSAGFQLPPQGRDRFTARAVGRAQRRSMSATSSLPAHGEPFPDTSLFRGASISLDLCEGVTSAGLQRKPLPGFVASSAGFSLE